MKQLKRLVGCAAVAAVVAGLVAPSPAVAARGRSLVFEECEEQTAFFPIPRSQGRTYLPDGFEAATGPADDENFTNFYVTSIVCGDGDAPQLELVVTHLVVEPPADAGSSSNHYVIDLVVEGPGTPAFQRTTCAPVERAAIEVTHEAARLPFGPQAGVATTSVTADSVSARFAVSAERTSGWGSENVRWFFGDGTRFFDSSSSLLFWGIGSSQVAFQQPYLDLPPAAAGASKQAIGEFTFTTPKACRSAR